MLELNFHPITIADKEAYNHCFLSLNRQESDYSFANIFAWADYYKVEMCFIEDAVIIKRRRIKEGIVYSYPLSVNRDIRVKLVREMMATIPDLAFFDVTEFEKDEILTFFPGIFQIDARRDRFDYVFSQDKMASFKGGGFSRKRQEIKQFKKLGEWSYEPISLENLEECWQFETNWSEKRKLLGLDPVLSEKQGLRRAMDHYEALDLFGGVIRLHGKIVAFCFAVRLNANTCEGLYLNADRQIPGAYQMINQAFALHHPEFTYINGECDLGIAGLRKSKTSYQPELLLKKYQAVIKRENNISDR